jgi:hypothetical protein
VCKINFSKVAFFGFDMKDSAFSETRVPVVAVVYHNNPHEIAI